VTENAQLASFLDSDLDITNFAQLEAQTEA
jgi:hypothetical protein